METLTADQLDGAEPIPSATGFERGADGNCAHCGHPLGTHAPGPDYQGAYCAVYPHPLILEELRGRQ